MNKGRFFGLSEAQLIAVRLHVIDKLSVVRAMYFQTFSTHDFKELTTEQIFNIGTIALTAPNCIVALMNGRTTIAQLAAIDLDTLRQAVESDNYSNYEWRP